MEEKNQIKVPKALFNSKALFNPYQYRPFHKIMEWKNGAYEWNGKNLLITDEVGVGKTFEAGIILRELLYTNPDCTVLILCPVKLCENWESELAEYFGISAINYQKNCSLGQISIVPYSFFTSNREGSQEEKLEIIYPYDVLILDEAHYIRNGGKRWSCISEMERRKNGEEPDRGKLRIFMTATPVFNSEHDYKNIEKLLRGDEQAEYAVTTTLQAEANCYDQILSIRFGGGCGKNGEPGDVIEKNGEPGDVIEASDCEREIIRDIFEGKYGRRTGFLKRISSSSFYSLKQYVEEDGHFDEMDKEDELQLDEMDKEDELQLEKGENNYEKLCSQLEQWKTDSKLESLKELFEYLKEKESQKNLKVIVFSCFLTTCSYLNEKLSKNYQTFMITGKTKENKIREYKAAFEKCQESSILICSDVLKEGLNLQFCHYLVHYDLPYTPAGIGQRNGRIYRKGQKDKPEVFYMLMDEGYDKRLFGEIIVEKCRIVEELSKKDKVSVLNILPQNADKYIKECVKKYIDDYFKQKEQEEQKKADKTSKEASAGAAVGDSKETAKKISKKFLEWHFKEKERGWTSKKAQDCYEELDRMQKAQDCYEELDGMSGEYKKRLTDFYIDILEDKDSGESIQKIYLERYKKQIKELTEKWFGKSDGGDKSEQEQFIECCTEYVKRKYKEKEPGCLYCHDMMKLEFGTEGTQISLDDYKDQFQYLKEWETEPHAGRE